MTWIATLADVPEGHPLKPLYEGWRKELGFIPEIVKATSVRPLVTRRLDDFRRAVTFGGSRLGRRREEMISTLVSVINKCHY